jgi:V-type H+-transporting ATPase subunit B
VFEEMLGRSFNGSGKLSIWRSRSAEAYLDINGQPINPSARDYPKAMIQTGISAIDVMNHCTWTKDSHLSAAGLPHNEVAAQINSSGIACQVEGIPRMDMTITLFVFVGVNMETALFLPFRFRGKWCHAAALFLNLAK